MERNGLFGLSVGTEHVDDLVHVKLLHLVTGRSEVLPRIELAGLLVEDLTDGGGHCKTAVGVDVDLADSALGGLAELLLGNTDCIRQFATVGVDDVHILLGHGRRSVEDDRESGKLLLDLVKDIECERRRNETAGLGIPLALLRLELVCAMGCSDGDGEGVATAAGSEFDDLLGTGVMGFLCGNLILYTGEDTQLGLDCDVVLVGVVDHLLGEGDVLLERKSGSIDHN